MRRLSRTVMAGGVIFPAGTTEAEVDGRITRADVWDGEPETKPKPKAQPEAEAEPAPKRRRRS